MTYPLSQIEGMNAFAASKLKKQGIRTTEALLEAAGTVKGRKELAAKTGISEQQLLEWANIADYMRIPGMGEAKAGLLRAAGVTTVRELALRNPVRLVEAMKRSAPPTMVAIVRPNIRPTSVPIEKIRRAVREIKAAPRGSYATSKDR